METEESKEQEKKENRKVIIVTSVVVVLIIATLIFSYFNPHGLVGVMMYSEQNQFKQSCMTKCVDYQVITNSDDVNIEYMNCLCNNTTIDSKSWNKNI